MTTINAPVLHQYEIIADISGKMLAQARHNNWGAVIELGQHYFEAVEQLRQHAPLTPDNRAARKALLTKILDDDAHIRNLAAPELARLGALIGSAKRQQAVLETYSAPAKLES